MKIQPFPLCCGAFVINDFGNTNNSAGYNGERSIEDVEKFLNETLPTYNGKSVIAILNEIQRDKLGKTLYKAGFRMRSKFWHAAHNNYCYYYIKNPKEPQ